MILSASLERTSSIRSVSGLLSTLGHRPPDRANPPTWRRVSNSSTNRNATDPVFGGCRRIACRRVGNSSPRPRAVRDVPMVEKNRSENLKSALAGHRRWRDRLLSVRY